jgi:hypothetical protein
LNLNLNLICPLNSIRTHDIATLTRLTSHYHEMTASASAPLPVETPVTASPSTLRSSKRKRQAVKYYESDHEDFVDDDDNVYSTKPPLKVTYPATTASMPLLITPNCRN